MKNEKLILHGSTRYVNLDRFSEEQRGDKKWPQLYRKPEECCGCSACYAICPMKAITMEPDEEGFLYPVVNVEKCVCCYKCISVCAFKCTGGKEG